MVYKVYNKRTRLIVESIHINCDELKEVMTFDDNTSGLTSVHNSTKLRIPDYNNEPSSLKLVLNVVPTSFDLSDNLQQKDTQATLNVQPTLELIIPLIDVNAKENNTYQAEDEEFEAYEFINPLLHQEQKLLSLPHTTLILQTCIHSTKDTVKTVILNVLLKEAVYLNQPDGFVDPNHPEKVYRLRKAHYGLKQAPRAWYDELSTFLILKGFSKDLSGSPVDKTRYRSMIGSLMYLTTSRPDLVQAMSKKQDCTAMSTTEAEYMALSASCAQVLWMRTQLKDYGFDYNKIPMYCNSQSAIAISCNHVQHSRTKHINLADMFTKALSKERFEYLVGRI
ncbi:retrovirus-related pol polyprotein from transposon TNT 1-94, partial [Tanacetum coccineum]